MLGETEIFRANQRRLTRIAQERRSTGRVGPPFQKGFQAAKHVRTQTAITDDA